MGNAVGNAVGSSNIGFSGLRTSWQNATPGGSFVVGPSHPEGFGSDPGTTNLSISEFRHAQFTNNTHVPGSGAISINTDFKNKSFGNPGGKSDRLLKKDIIYLGKSVSGIPLYSWMYIDGYKLDTKNRYQGTMAQDLLEMGLTDAIIPKDENGFLGVDYKKLPDVICGPI